MALPKQRTSKTMSEADSREQFGQILDGVKRDESQVIIEKDGVPIAAIVPLSVLQADADRERARQRALDSLREVQEAFADVPEEEAERELAQALAEVKQERLTARRIVSALVQADPNLFASSEESLVKQVSTLLRHERPLEADEGASNEGTPE